MPASPDGEAAPRVERPVAFAVVTVSDTRTLETDTSGALLAERLGRRGHELVARHLVTDDPQGLEELVRTLVADATVEVVMLTGGTGLTGRDGTPEVLSRVATREIPGFGELFRWLSFEEIGTSTVQSRACGVVSGTTLLFALPGSTGACRLAWDRILDPQFDVAHRPCNFVDILPRLGER